MSQLEKRLEKKMQFWAIIGPVIVILTMLISMAQWNLSGISFSLVALIGIVSCWIWKMRGLWFGVVGIALYLFLALSDVSSHERLWNLGLALALLMGFVITALSLEEVGSMLRQMRYDAGEMTEQHSLLSSTLQATNQKWLQEQLVWQQRLQQLTDEREHKAQEALRLEKMAAALQGEMEAQRKSLAELLQENQGLRRDIAHLQPFVVPQEMQSRLTEEKDELIRKVEAFEKSLASTEDKLQQAIQKLCQERLLHGEEKQQMAVELDEKQKELQAKEAMLTVQKAEFEKLFLQAKTVEGERALLCAAKDEMSQKIERLLGDLKHAEERYQEQIKELEASNAKLLEMKAPALVESQTLEEQEWKRLRQQEALFKQLRAQFEEKTEVLHQTRIQVFRLEGELFCLEKEIQEQQLNEDALQKELLLQIEALDCEKQYWEKEAANLEELVSHLFAAVPTPCLEGA